MEACIFMGVYFSLGHKGNNRRKAEKGTAYFRGNTLTRIRMFIQIGELQEVSDRLSGCISNTEMNPLPSTFPMNYRKQGVNQKENGVYDLFFVLSYFSLLLCHWFKGTYTKDKIFDVINNIFKES